MADTAGTLGGTTILRDVFERAAAVYDRHAALEREVGDRLLERVTFQRHEPSLIVDLGCGTGYCTRALKRRYRKALVVGVDHALGMCRRARARSTVLMPLRIACGEVRHLPVAGRSTDLIFANLAFQWGSEFTNLFNGLRRVLRPGGLLLFSVLGAGSMQQLQAACAQSAVESGFRVFPDLHAVGDALLAAGFDEPVMDTETLTLHYRTIEQMLRELEATGAASHCARWGDVRDAVASLAAAWPPSGIANRFPLSWEVVYGAAFGPAEGRPVKTAEGDLATFSVEALRGARPPR